MTLELHATPEDVMRAVEAFQEFARAKGVPEKIVFGLALALEECGSNVVNHALQRDPLQVFTVSFEHRGIAMVIELRDRGPEFDPVAVTNCKQHAEDDDPPGGWGIHLVRHHVNEIRYERAGEVNVLRLTRRLVDASKPE